MNRLQHETSPYLLQHAHNPVDWYAWKPEAFDRARKEGKPILVSIGYSTCHWCHVMERESFEDEEVAGFMNEHFINIKVDREERPDVDQIYMEACQAISGSGGWPLNAFLLPDGRPFFAGTYFPPRPAHNRPSWMQLLRHLLGILEKEPEKVEEQAERLTQYIRDSDDVFIKKPGIDAPPVSDFDPGMADRIYNRLEANFDREQGGFGAPPKFPGAMALRYLLEYHYFTGSAEALDHLKHSLSKMIRGGIYDQLGGGFARYATDRNWLIPHFEKMLYDNALLVTLLADAYQLTGEPLYRNTIRETLAFVEREMTNEAGGFYSALDADSEGEEGKFYVWQKTEIEERLGDTAPLFCEFYGVTEAGNWEGANILWRPHDESEFAEGRSLDPAALAQTLAQAREKLFAARAQRVRPGLDDKVLLSWNALMCTAYARAYAALGDEAYRTAAERNLHFLLEKMTKDEGPGLYHTYKNGQAQYDAFLEDYAFLIEALIEVYSITFDVRWLERAEAFAGWVQSAFLDAERKLFYFISAEQEQLIARKLELYDGALPSGNATLTIALQQLGILTGKREYRELAAAMLTRMQETLEKYPSSFARWARGALRLIHPWREIAVVGPAAYDTAREINARYLPNKVIMAAVEAKDNWPLLAGKGAGGDTKIYVCRDYACGLPVDTIAAMQEQIATI